MSSHWACAGRLRLTLEDGLSRNLWKGRDRSRSRKFKGSCSEYESEASGLVWGIRKVCRERWCWEMDGV